MKSQDILLLLKIISLHDKFAEKDFDAEIIQSDDEWADWDEKGLQPTFYESEHLGNRFSVRNLAEATGISKSQISLSLNRMYAVGLAKVDRKLQVPNVNKKALLGFLENGIRYVFPAKEGGITRGIATSIAAPVLRGKLMTSGDLQPVWSDPKGRTKGLLIEPLHHNVFIAIQDDAQLYAMLALTDAIRIGHARERNLALDMLKNIFRV